MKLYDDNDGDVAISVYHDKSQVIDRSWISDKWAKHDYCATIEVYPKTSESKYYHGVAHLSIAEAMILSKALAEAVDNAIL